MAFIHLLLLLCELQMISSVKDCQIMVKINTGFSLENGNTDLKYVRFVQFLCKHDIALYP
jgi:hypothetical protein